MLYSFRQWPYLRHLAAILGALIISIAAGCSLLIWPNPLASLLVATLCIGVVGGLFLFQNPNLALYSAIFLILLPMGLRFEPFYTIIVNGSIALAFASWFMKAFVYREPIVWEKVCILLVIYVCWGIFTLFWAEDVIEGRRKIIAYCISLIILFLIINQAKSLSLVDGIMRSILVIGWILVCGGVYTVLFTGYEFGTRLKVLDMNENQFGITLMIAIPAVIWPVLRSEGFKRRLYMLVSVVFILLSVMLVALSGSRGSTISMVLILIAFWFWKPMRAWGTIGVIVLFIGISSAPFLLETIVNRFEEQEGGTLGGRAELWQASLLLIRDHPLTGAGIGNGRYMLHGYIEALTNLYSNRNDLPSHNPFFEVGIDSGIVGMSLYIAAVTSVFWRFLRQYRYWRTQTPSILNAYFPLIMCITVGYLSSWIKSGGMENHPTFFLLLGLLLIPAQLTTASVLGKVKTTPGVVQALS